MVAVLITVQGQLEFVLIYPTPAYLEPVGYSRNKMIMEGLPVRSCAWSTKTLITANNNVEKLFTITLTHACAATRVAGGVLVIAQ